MSLFLQIKNKINSLLGIQIENINHVSISMCNNSNSENTITYIEHDCIKKETAKNNTKRRKTSKITYPTLICDKCGKSLINKCTYMYKDHKFCSYICKNSFDFDEYYPY